MSVSYLIVEISRSRTIRTCQPVRRSAEPHRRRRLAASSGAWKTADADRRRSMAIIPLVGGRGKRRGVQGARRRTRAGPVSRVFLARGISSSTSMAGTEAADRAAAAVMRVGAGRIGGAVGRARLAQRAPGGDEASPVRLDQHPKSGEGLPRARRSAAVVPQQADVGRAVRLLAAAGRQRTFIPTRRARRWEASPGHRHLRRRPSPRQQGWRRRLRDGRIILTSSTVR